MPELVPALIAVLAGLAASTINAIVGSGTLISFPVLLALGLPPVTANMTSSVALLAGNASSIPGYRSAIEQGRHLLPQLLPASIAGGLVGAILLLVLPEKVFAGVVPVLIALALVLVAVGPWVQKRVAQSRPDAAQGTYLLPAPVVAGLVGLTGIYGGYFGAAQGVIVIGLLGILTTLSIQVTNGLKVVLALAVNLVGSLFFVVAGFDRIHWGYVACVALGSVFGGLLGARIGRSLSPWALRIVVLVVGTVALVRLLTS